jgi:acetyltransferase-like isoleucine patch superfamily enzyme
LKDRDRAGHGTGLLRRGVRALRACLEGLGGRLVLSTAVDVHCGHDVGSRRGLRLRVTDGGWCELGDGVRLDRFIDITVSEGRLVIGDRSFVGQGCVIVSKELISIGSDCLIAEYVTIRDQDHAFGPGRITSKSGFRTAPIIIGNNVWIGAKSTITRGVTIGDNAVIGANSVVTRDVGNDTIVVGAPARAIGTLNDRGVESHQ